MILTGPEIAREVERGRIAIEPFEPARLTTNSYDLALGETLLRYVGETLDPRVDNLVETIAIPAEGFNMARGEFVLGSSVETVGSNHYVPIIHARSGTARLGLFVHCSTGLIDIGSHGQITFQLYATLPVLLKARTIIAQVTFWVPQGEILLYDGKYQASRGPRASQAFRDRVQ